MWTDCQRACEGDVFSFKPVRNSGAQPATLPDPLWTENLNWMDSVMW